MKKALIPIAISLLLLTGCLPQPQPGNETPSPTKPAESFAPTATETARASIAAATTGTAAPPSARTTAGHAAGGWPSGVPENVPVFDYGSQVKQDLNGGEVTIVFTGVSKSDYAAYRDRLTNAGFFLASEDVDPEGVSEFSMNGPNCVISLRVTKDDFAMWKYTPAG